MMKKRNRTYIFTSLFFLLFSIIACKKDKEASEIPVIEYNSYELFGGDSLVISFHFIDGNGDIGFREGDTLAPYNTEYRIGDPLLEYKYMSNNGEVVLIDSLNKNGYNLILTYMEYTDGVWVKPELSPRLIYRLKDISPQGQDPYLEGDMDISLTYPSLIFSDSKDSVKYFIELQDRALNISNTVETELIK